MLSIWSALFLIGLAGGILGWFCVQASDEASWSQALVGMFVFLICISGIGIFLTIAYRLVFVWPRL
jgi:hypothetical protein